ncbi:hypothetical protein [Flavobacterium sp.]|uniref:hypothetical protein n=1 Tax=Flavobacterium sp. TaxID=239 RepID=UPI003528D5D1
MSIYTRSLLFLISILFWGCSSTLQGNEKKCSKILKNNFSEIQEAKFISVINKDSLFLNEVQYVCVYSSMYTKKGMYDRFGKWNKVIYPQKSTHPILVWENVALFPADPTLFTVAALGLESRSSIYASVLVFDQNREDMLRENSPYKAKLIDYFGEMIKSDDSLNSNFYETYWKMVDSERWELIKKSKK